MKIQVLIVDDEALISESLGAFLEDEGMTVTTDRCAEDAIDRLQDGAQFQVCIMDIRLPGANGDEAICRMHAMSPQLQFLIHTGSSDYDLSTELRGIGLGDHHLFRKPLIDMSAVAQAIRQLT